MAGTPGHSGGARPGSGRKFKTRAEYIEPIRQHVEDCLQQHIDQRLANLEQLATGGLQIVTEHWELAGSLPIDQCEEVLDIDGAPTGKTITRKTRLLPDKAVEELVLVSRTVKTLAANLAANVYLVNRLLGKPTPVSSPPDEGQQETVSEEFENLITRIYGSDNFAPTPCPNLSRSIGRGGSGRELARPPARSAAYARPSHHPRR